LPSLSGLAPHVVEEDEPLLEELEELLSEELEDELLLEEVKDELLLEGLEDELLEENKF